jgi:hypothetical protein
MLEKQTPHEMIQGFSSSAPTNVQAAVKSTVVNILGSLPNYALDAALLTTSNKLSNLLHQMQMTGYMFKNAEYRMSFTRSLKGLPRLSSYEGDISIDDEQEDDITSGRKVMVRTTDGLLVEVAVPELSQSLNQEVLELRQELEMIRHEREHELKSNLLTYIQALPNEQLAELSSDVRPEVCYSLTLNCFFILFFLLILPILFQAFFHF